MLVEACIGPECICILEGNPCLFCKPLQQEAMKRL